MPTVTKKKRRLTARQRQTRFGINKRWRDLFALLPQGYDPCDQAGDVYVFDADKAEDAIAFFHQHLKHPTGPKAGQPFILEPWQVAVVGCLFGWVDKRTGLRRYTEALLYIGKKNGKTTLAAGITLYVQTQIADHGSEIIGAAASKDQAGILFKYAALMVRHDAALNGAMRIYGEKGGGVTKSILYERKSIAYKTVSANADVQDGANPYLVLIDEVHRHRSAELADVLVKSQAARDEPLALYTTTSDYNRPSLCNDLRKRALRVIENKGDPRQVGYEPQFFPIVFEATLKEAERISKTKDGERFGWELERIWRKANPNLGVTVTHRFMEREAVKAKENPGGLNNFMRLHLNIVTDAAEAWIPMDRWDGCEDARTDPLEWRAEMLEEMRGKVGEAALDLSSTRDLTALVAVWKLDNDYIVIPWFWLPEKSAAERDRKDDIPYMTWAREGLIELTEGDYIDQSFVLAKMVEVCKAYGFKQVQLDRWMARQVVTELREHDIEPIEFGQGFGDMSNPAKRLETLVGHGRIRHGNNPILRWNISNTMVRRDPADNIKPDKATSGEKIDGTVALVMALGGWMVREVDYDDAAGEGEILWGNLDTIGAAASGEGSESE